jgi:hypothetical protein
MQKILFYFIILFLSQITFAQITLSPNTKISVLTCGTGDELYSLFGHTGLRIQDPNNQLDIVYNFGMFDFSTPNFYTKFIKGDLLYFGTTESFGNFMYQYQYFGRSVVEQELNIESTTKQKIFDDLNQILQSEKKYYEYKFIDENCTTKVWQVLNQHLPVKLTKVGKDFPSYREVINDKLGNRFFEKLGINLMFGSKTDVAATQIFLPEELQESLQQQASLKATNSLLLRLNKDYFSIWNHWWIWLVIVAFFSFVKLRTVSTIWFWMQGLLGIFLLFVGWYSHHHEVSNNYNPLVVNPILIGISLLWLSKNKMVLYAVVSYFILSLVFVILHFQKDHFWIMCTFLLSNWWILYRKLIENYNYHLMLKNISIFNK